MASHVYSIFNKNVDPGDKPKNTDYKLIKEYGREEGYKAGLYARVIDGQYFYATVFAGTDDFTDICTDGTIGSGGISSGETTLAIMDATRIDSWVWLSQRCECDPAGIRTQDPNIPISL